MTLAALLVAVPAAFAVVIPDQDDPLRQKEFRHSELWYENVFRPIADLPPGMSRQLGVELQALGADPGNAYFDLRTDRWGTLIVTQPLIPGRGVGNDLRWSDLGITAPEDNEALERATWAAFESFLTRHAAELRIDPTQLAEPIVTPIGDHLIQIHAGRQIGGILVRDTFVKAAVNSGNLVLTGERNWGPVRVSTTPTLSAGEAETVLREYLAEFPNLQIGAAAHLELIPVSSQPEEAATLLGASLEHRLAWVLRPTFEGDLGGWEALVDAHDGELLAFVDTNHYASRQVGGGIFPVSNDGQGDDGTLQFDFPMPFADIAVDGVPLGFTTSGGNVPPGAESGTITTELSGQFVRMNDTCGDVLESSAGGDLDLDGVPLPGTDCDVPADHSVGDTNASRSGFYELNRLVGQAQGYLPDNTWLQQQLTANMNINLTCNAFWNGSTVNFYQSGGGCGNTGEIAAIFDHEWGHGIDDNDGNGFVSSPGESIADIIGQNRLNTSCIGRGFLIGQNCGGYGDACLDCSGVRESDWEKRASGDPHGIQWILDSCGNFGSRGPCNRETHCEGTIVAEAAWDLVHRDLQGFEGSPFDLDPNTALEIGTRLSFYGSSNVGDWYQCSTDGTGGCNSDGGYLGFLAADDDNGDLTDGTPHMSAIFAAFDRHQLSCATPVVQDSGCAGAPTTAPENLAATTFDEGADLSWDAVDGATEYWIFRTEGVHGCDFGKTLVGKTAETTFGQTGLRNGFEVFYSVLAVGATDACTSPMSACLPVTPTAGPSGVIAGTVTDVDTGDPIEGAAVTAEGPVTVSDETDATGAYQIVAPVGTYDVTASAAGYDPVTETGVPVTEGGTETVDFALTLTAVPIADISPDSFTFEVPQGASDSDTLNIGNLGVLDLEWSIAEDDIPALAGAATLLEPWSDNFDTYDTGSQLHGQGGWKGWANDPAAGALASDAQAQSAPNSAEIVGASDLVHEYVDSTAGQWAYTAWQFVPTDLTGLSYFIMLNSYDDAGSNLNWSVQVSFNGDTDTVLNEGASGGSLPLITGEWVELRVEIDLDADTQNFFYNGELLYSGTWTGEVSGAGELNIGAVDLFANGASAVYYDDLSLVDNTVPPACSDPNDVPWLSVNPTSGVTPPESTLPVEVTVDTTGLEVGEHAAHLCVTTNDPAAPLVDVPVSLSVISADTPVIDVDPDSMDSTLPTGGSETQGLTISNIGGGTLDWQVTEDGALKAAGPRTAGSLAASRAGRSAAAAATAPRSAVPNNGSATDLASALGSPLPSLQVLNPTFGGVVDCEVEPGIVIHDDGTLENGYSGNPLAGVTEVRFVDKFTPAAYPATYSAVCVGFITGNGPTSYDVEVVVFDDDGAGGEPGTELGSVAATVTVTEIAVPIPPGTMAVWNSIDISSLGLEVTDGSVYIGARWAPIGSGLGNVFIAGDQSTDRPEGFAGGHWWNNNANLWEPIQSAFPGYRSLMVRAVEGGGGEPVDCALPTWVSVDPTSGSLPGGESQVADVTFDAAGLEPGTYEATLCLASNDPTTPLVEIPLTLTVDDGGPGGPIADITPDAFSFEVPAGGSDSDTLNVGNIGDADLTWSLEEAEAIVVPEGAPYRYGLAGAPEFHAPVGYDRASGITRSRGEAPADAIVLPAPQEMALGDFAEGFDDITQLPGAGWALINNSDPQGPSSWFQGNESIFPSHEGAPNAYIAANYESTDDVGTISNWLVTPEVTIVNGTTMTFWTRKAELFGDFADRLEVRMSAEGASTDVGDTADSVGDFTTLLLTVNPDLVPGEYPQEWTSFTVTVRERSREPVTGRFAFRYFVTDAGPNGVNADYIGIDTVSVTQPGGPPPGGCDNPLDIPWLAADPTSGTTPPAGTVPVTVTVDTTDLEIGEHTAQLCVTTNDPAALLVPVPVTLTVTEGGDDPLIDVDPDSMSSTLPEGGTETQPLTIANVGAGTLDWQVTEEGFAGRTSAASGSAARLSPRGLTEAEKLRLGESGRRPVAETFGAARGWMDPTLAPDTPDRSVRNVYSSLGSLTFYEERGEFQTVNPGLPLEDFSDTNVPDNNVLACDPPFNSDTDNDCFSPGDIEPGASMDVTPNGGTELGVVLTPPFAGVPCVSVGPNTFVDHADWDFDPAVHAVGFDLQSDVAGAVFTVTIFGPGGELGTTEVTAAGLGAPVFFGVDTADPEGISRIEVRHPEAGELFCDVEFGGEQGEPGGDCTLPSWVSVDPTSGSVPAGSSQVANVTFDSTGLEPGTYEANLCLASNDPVTPLLTVPLTLTVEGGGGLDEPLAIPDFEVVSPANGGEPVVLTVPGGVVNPGDVTGFNFIGTASGLDDTDNISWASDTCMIITAPDGTIFGVGGISGTDPNCAVNDWDFQGSDSQTDGTYESTHEGVFAGIEDAGDWTFTFINDWDSTDAVDISWSEVTVTLHKTAAPATIIRVTPGSRSGAARGR